MDSKILSPDEAAAFVAGSKAAGETVVVTNGCFDILHLGHVTYLQQARSLGDKLVIAVNSDESVRELKGPTRPINPENARMRVLAALEVVSAVVLFPEKRATRILASLKPSIYVKGGDYQVDQLDPDEVAAVEAGGGVIRILPVVSGFSTTGMIDRVQNR